MAAQNKPVPKADEHRCVPRTAVIVLEICSSALCSSMSLSKK